MVSCKQWWCGFIALLVFTHVLFFGLQHNRFAYFYHTDEPVKCQQVDRNEMNFFHPLLMINTTRAVYALSGERARYHNAPKAIRYQKIVETGRCINAVCAALAAAILVLIVSMYWGVWASAMTAVSVGLSPALLHAAHTFKEDAGLLLGLALVLLTISIRKMLGKAFYVVLPAMACATAAATKYPGLVFYPILLGVFWFDWRSASQAQRVKVIAGFTGVFVLTWLFWNAQVLSDPLGFLQGFGDEAEHVASSHMGLIHQAPIVAHWQLLQQFVPAVYIVLAGCSVLWLLSRASNNPASINVFLIFTLCYGFAAGVARIFSYRYYITVEVLVLFLGALGAVGFIRWLTRGQPRLYALVCSVFILMSISLLWPSFQRQVASYQSDDYQALYSWLSHHVLPQERVAYDKLLRLRQLIRLQTQPTTLSRQQILDPRAIGDLGSPQQICKKGVRWIVVSNSQYERYFDPYQRSTRRHQHKNEQRKRVYQAVFQYATVQWQRPLGVSILKPGIQVYRVTPQFCAISG